MYISPRAALVRNISVSIINGSITLIILLIAPLGIVAVIINTLLVIMATYAVTVAADGVLLFLQRDRQTAFFDEPSRQAQLRLGKASQLDRRR
jgi:uncharacterized membrane protein